LLAMRTQQFGLVSVVRDETPVRKGGRDDRERALQLPRRGGRPGAGGFQPQV